MSEKKVKSRKKKSTTTKKAVDESPDGAFHAGRSKRSGLSSKKKRTKDVSSAARSLREKKAVEDELVAMKAEVARLSKQKETIEREKEATALEVKAMKKAAESEKIRLEAEAKAAKKIAKKAAKKAAEAQAMGGAPAQRQQQPARQWGNNNNNSSNNNNNNNNNNNFNANQNQSQNQNRFGGNSNATSGGVVSSGGGVRAAASMFSQQQQQPPQQQQRTTTSQPRGFQGVPKAAPAAGSKPANAGAPARQFKVKTGGAMADRAAQFTPSASAGAVDKRSVTAGQVGKPGKLTDFAKKFESGAMSGGNDGPKSPERIVSPGRSVRGAAAMFQNIAANDGESKKPIDTGRRGGGGGGGGGLVSGAAAMFNGGGGGGGGGGVTAAQARANESHKLDENIGLLIKGIKRIAEADEAGRPMVTFGALFKDEWISDRLDALVSTLKQAKKRRVVHFEGEMLFQGSSDAVEVTLLSEAVGGSLGKAASSGKKKKMCSWCGERKPAAKVQTDEGEMLMCKVCLAELQDGDDDDKPKKTPSKKAAPKQKEKEPEPPAADDASGSSSSAPAPAAAADDDDDDDDESESESESATESGDAASGSETESGSGSGTYSYSETGSETDSDVD